MTFDQFQDALSDIRAKQGTRCPLVRIDYAGMVVRGRLARADSDPGSQHASNSPYGVVVVESPGLCRAPETILQIANIPENGVHALEEV